MPRRKHKKYSRPQRPFDKARIEEENAIRDKYGLKNKREIWKADASIKRVRDEAKKLITASKEEQDVFIERLNKKGFKVENIADVLSLGKGDWLERRLQTVVFRKGLVRTPKQARQLITHKNVAIGSQTVNKPSYQVSLSEEPKIKLKIVLKNKEEKKDKIEEIKEGVVSGEDNIEEVNEVPVKEKPIEVEAK